MKNNFIEVVKYLIEKTPIDVNARTESTQSTNQAPSELTALHLAILEEKPPIVTVLLTCDRLDVNTVNEVDIFDDVSNTRCLN